MSSAGTPPTMCDTADQALVGRQPIYNQRLEVIAYELLYRSQRTSTTAGSFDPEAATAEVVLSALAGIGLDAVVQDKVAFFNVSRGFLLNGRAAALPADRVVLEVLEDVTVDAELMKAVSRLQAEGYSLAVDDFFGQANLEPLLEYVDIVKVELPAIPTDELAERLVRWRGSGVKLLAEKVETREQFRLCRQLAFDYFQGYFLQRPEIVAGKQLRANHLSILRLIGELRRPEISIREVEQLIRQDAGLAFHLLRLANSAAYARVRETSSLREAVQRLGLKTVTAWASLLLLTRLDDRPGDLMTVALVRALFCEGLARKLDQPEPEKYYVAGLCSVLDAMLDQPMTLIAQNMGLEPQLALALLSREGAIGGLLSRVIAYERGQWDELDGSQVPPEFLRETYLSAVAEADSFTAQLASQVHAA